MGNFEKLSVLVIVVIIVMILVVAIYTWTDNPDNSAVTGSSSASVVNPQDKDKGPIGPGFPSTKPAEDDPWVFPKDEFLVEPIVKTVIKPVEPIEKLVVKEPKKPSDPKKASDSDTPGEPWMYTIKGGDCLTLIAQNELGTMHRVDDIIVLNPGLSRDSVLRAGRLLKMPARGAVSTNPPRIGAGGATQPTSTGGPKVGEIYLTQGGDTLEKISKLAFGSTDYWPEIWAKNLDVLDAPKDMRAGLKLMIPKVKKFK